MNRMQACVSLCAALLVGACGSPMPRPSPAPPSPPPPTVAPDPSIALVGLADLTPPPALPASGSRQDDTSERAERQIEKAQQLLQAQRYTEAQEALSRALRYSPSSYKAHLLMAEVALQAGNSARALEHLEQARAIRPDDPELYYLLGKAHLQQKHWDEAIVALQTISLCPAAADHAAVLRVARYHLATALEKKGFLTAAAQSYASFLGDLDPQSTDPRDREAQDVQLSACVQLAELHSRLNQPQDAARMLSRAAELAPDRTEYLERIASWHRQAGNLDEAAAAAKRFFEATGKGLDVWIEIRQQAGPREALLAELQQLAAAHPDRAEVTERLTDLYIADQELDAGCRALQTLVDADPDHLQAQASLAELRALQGQWDESLNLLDRPVLTLPDPQLIVERWLARIGQAERRDAALAALGPRLQAATMGGGQAFALAGLAAAAGRKDLTRSALESSVRKAPDFVPARAALGELQLEEYEWEAALQTAEGLIAAAPEDHLGHRIKGQALLGLDRLEEALEALNVALRFNRQDIPTMEALVQVYTLDNKPLKARQQYRMILEVDPGNAGALEALFQNAMNEGDARQAGEYLERLGAQTNRIPFRRAAALLAARESGDWAAFEKTLREILQDQPDDLDSRLQLVQVLVRDERFSEAQDELAPALALQPPRPMALLVGANLAFQRLEYDAGIKLLRRLLQIHPRRSAWQLALVQALMNDQRFPEAVGLLQDLLAQPLEDPLRSRFRRDLIICLCIDGRNDEAASQLRSWLESEPDAFELRALLLHVARLGGQARPIAAEIENWYLQNGGNDDRARRLLLEACLASGREDDAAVLTLGWLEVDPEDPEGTWRLLQVLRKTGKSTEAIELADAAVLSAPNEETQELLERLRVELLIAAGEHEAAIRSIRERLNIEFADADASEPGRQGDLRRQLAAVLIEAGRPEEALRELQVWEQLIPRARSGEPATPGGGEEQQQVYSMRSLCYQMTGQTSLAMQEQERRWQLAQDSSATNNDLGYMWAAESLNLDKAEPMIRRAVRMNPRRAAYLDSLGWVLYKKGRFEEAWFWLERAARTPMEDWDDWLESEKQERGSDDPVIQDHQGDTAWRLNRREDAVRCWLRAVELAQKQEGYRSPDVQHILDHGPEKVEAAHSDREPGCASFSRPEESP